MGCSSDTFHFKQFSVCHAGCAMKIGTDGVLLGLLVRSEGRRVLDVGTGSGLIALLLAQRNADAQITGIDIDADASRQAALNFEASPWKERLHAVCEDVRHHQAEHAYDLMVSNPPYFEHSPATSSAARDTARLGGSLSHAELLDVAARLLAPKGRFAVILPSEQREDFVYGAWQRGMACEEVILIKTTPAKPAKPAILSFVADGSVRQTERTFCLSQSDGSRSPEYQQLVQDFFIK